VTDSNGHAPATTEPLVTDEALKKAEEFIEEEEGAVSRFRGWLGGATTTLLVAMSLFHLYAAVDIVPAQVLRPVFVGFVLLLVFILFPIAPRFRNRLMWWDIACAALGVATIVYLLAGGDDIWDRNVVPTRAGAARAGSLPGWSQHFSATLSRGRGCRASGRIAATTCRACRASCTRRSKVSSERPSTSPRR